MLLRQKANMLTVLNKHSGVWLQMIIAGRDTVLSEEVPDWKSYNCVKGFTKAFLGESLIFCVQKVKVSYRRHYAF